MRREPRKPRRVRQSWSRLRFVLTLLAMPASVANAAQDQFWPEFDGFYDLNERNRIFLKAAATRAEDAQEGDPRYRDTTLGVHLDVSLEPILRRLLMKEDWERSRYLWMRVGYNYVENHRADGASFNENRGIFELSSRHPLMDALTLTGRLKWDLRDIEGNTSNRYRVRIGLETSTRVFNHTVVPYAHAETAYDSRFDKWNRQRYQAGVEITLNKQWRLEPYLARQNDSVSEPAHVNALGLTLKYYH